MRTWKMMVCASLLWFPATTTPAQVSENFVESASIAAQAVVTIESETKRLARKRFQFQTGPAQALGPFLLHVNAPHSGGFAVAKDLVIAHGFGEPGEAMKLRTADGQSIDGKIVCNDWVTGLCCIRLSEPTLNPLALHTGDLELGQTVLGISVNEESGAVVGLAMISSQSDSSATQLGHVHRLSLLGEPIDLGSPLVNTAGECVGVLMVSGPSVVALPTQTVTRLVESAQSEEPSDLRAGRLGIELTTDQPPQIRSIAVDSPAAEAGLSVVSTIRTIDGVAIRTANDVLIAISQKRAGDQVEITTTSDGEEETYSVELSVSDAPHVSQRNASVNIGQGMWRLEDGKLVPFGNESNRDKPDFAPVPPPRILPPEGWPNIAAPQIRGLEVERSQLENEIKELQRKADAMREEIQSLKKREQTAAPEGMSAERIRELVEQLQREVESLQRSKK